MKRFSFLAILMIFFLAGHVWAANTSDVGDKDAADKFGAMVKSIVSLYVDPATALSDMKKTVGMVVSIVGVNGSGVYGFGATEAGGQRVPDGDTIFQIGSVTKVLTGLMLAREVIGTSGLKKTDLVARYLPPVEGCNGTENVTLEMLVSHYSGLDSMPTNLPKKDPFSPATGYSRPNLKEFLCGLPAPVQAGKAYKYSNVGAGLLGLALERHLDASDYHDLLKKTLLKDFKITDMWGQVSKIGPNLKDRFAQGYATRGSKRIPGHFSQMGVLASAGEVTTTGNAMLILLQALTGQKPSALDAAIEESLKPIKPAKGNDQIGYAIEIMPGPPGGGPIYKKPGSTVGGYTAFLAFRRNPAVGVAVLTNAQRYRSVMPIATGILKKLSMMAKAN